MKKIRGILILMLTLAALAVTAYAAAPTQSGVYGDWAAAGYTLTVKDAAGTPIDAQTATVGDKDQNFYPEAVRFTLTTPSLAGQQLVLALEGDSDLPTEKNIRYIDQKPASGSVVFEIYPSDLKAGTYSVCIVGEDGKLKKVAGFGYYQAYRLGDIDNDGYWTANDALYALQIAVNKTTLRINNADVPVTELMRLAANVDVKLPGGDQYVTANDALLILQKAVGKDVF